MRTRLLTLMLAMWMLPACLTAQIDTTSRGVIRGVLLDTLGHPAPGFLVELTHDSVGPLRTPAKGTALDKASIALVTTDADGQFRFGPLAPNTYRVTAYDVWLQAGLGSLTLPSNDSLSVQVRLRFRYWHETPDSVRQRRLAELAQARMRWAARGPKRYRLTAEIDCFCFARFHGTPTLEFRGSSLVGAPDSSGRLRRPAWSEWKQFAIPTLFAIAENVIRDPERFVEKLEYDPTYGFPTVIATDTAREPSEGWFRQYVSGFRAIR